MNNPYIDRSEPREVVCLCGSTRFYKLFEEMNLRLTLEGKIVLSVGCHIHSDDALELTEEVKEKLDILHMRKIDLADTIFVINPGGYVGSSTLREIGYAYYRGCKIQFLEQPICLGKAEKHGG